MPNVTDIAIIASNGRKNMKSVENAVKAMGEFRVRYFIRTYSDGKPQTEADLVAGKTARTMKEKVLGLCGRPAFLTSAEEASRELTNRDQRLMDTADIVLVFPSDALYKGGPFVKQMKSKTYVVVPETSDTIDFYLETLKERKK